MSGTAPGRRGRPARLSREQIIETAATLVLSEPHTPLTMTRAAEAVGAKQMAMYRHFTDRDDLVAAVAQRLFAEVRVPSEPDAPWQETLSAWMLAKVRMAARVPQFVQLAATGRSAGWLVDYAFLAELLERAGFHDDDGAVAEAAYWVGSITMGQMLICAGRETTLPLDRLRQSMAWLDDDAAARVARFLPHFEELQEHGHDHVVTWTVESLEQRLATHPEGKRTSTGVRRRS